MFRQAARRTKKKRAARANSNVFARFDQDQIAEFKDVTRPPQHPRTHGTHGTHGLGSPIPLKALDKVCRHAQRAARTQNRPWYLRGWYCPHQYPTPTNGLEQTTLRTGSAVPRQPLRQLRRRPPSHCSHQTQPFPTISPAWRLDFQGQGDNAVVQRPHGHSVASLTLPLPLTRAVPAVQHRAQAFEVIDTNNDGFITKEDLKVILASLCKRSPRMPSRTPRLSPVPHAATQCG